MVKNPKFQAPLTTPAKWSRRELLKYMGAVLTASPCVAYSWAEVLTNSPVTFVDVARSSGITFEHDNAASPEKYLIETMGAGCGWIDYDQNGLFDLYLVNGAATRIYNPKRPLRSELYRNNGDGTFSDVTEKVGVGAEGLFGMGVAVGDYDNDGFPDLFVLGYGRCILYHNNNDGTFSDVTTRAGVENRGRWASSAAWFDYDNDGRLDLVIANYVDWSPERNFYCGDEGPGMRSYCHPDDFHGQPPTLYHNNGDGTFTDASQSSGVGVKGGNGLGIVTFDYDNDGWQDIFIANDHMPNFLFHNNRGIRGRRCGQRGRSVRSRHGNRRRRHYGFRTFGPRCHAFGYATRPLLPEQGRPNFRRRDASVQDWLRHVPHERIRNAVFRLRQRRCTRPLHG
jgi:hypothetical protein